MIRVVAFDLDGTLVQTETLKAASYGKATVELCPACASEREVTEAFKDLAGRSRQAVSEELMKRFKLENAARARMKELGVSEAWEAFAETRMRIYQQMLNDPELLRSHQLQHNIDLLHRVGRFGYKRALSTSSTRDEALRVLDVLQLSSEFDLIATTEDVERIKPDPEIYLFICRSLGIETRECLAIEDSPPGIKSAVDAGLHCIAVTTAFTRDAVHEERLIDERWIVDNPDKLEEVFDEMIAEAAL